MSVSIALICEGTTDPPTICTLADRVIVDGCPEWITAEDIDTHRHYRGFLPTEPFLAWSDIDTLASKHGVRSRGHFEGLPLHGDGHDLRKALVLLTLYGPSATPVEAVICFRDGDKQYEDREQALRRVRDGTPLPIPVVLGVANRMRECWVLHGFEPVDEDEQKRLAAVHDEVGFDPRYRAHELTATNQSEDRSPKRVLRALTDGDRDRERVCVWERHDILRERGTETGLTTFLDELVARLIAAFR